MANTAADAEAIARLFPSELSRQLDAEVAESFSLSPNAPSPRLLIA